MGNKVYLGDGAYAEWDGAAWVLTTSNGIRDTNRIVLEPEVMAALEAFVASMREAKAAP